MRKNIVYIFSIILLGLSLTQCTDNLENEKDVHGHETVFVQLTVANASTRTISSEETTGLSATWEIGDKLYVVAPTGGSLGYLTAKETGTSALFEGHISAWSGTQNLQLYYLGKGATIANGATSFTYDISSQNGTLAYVATKQLMHGSTSSVDSETTTFTGTITLQNLFSVAKLDLATNLDETATLTCGLSYSTASLDLATGALTPTDGQIALGTNLSNASAYYMVLIPGTSRLRFSDGTTAKTMYKYIDADRFYCEDNARASVVVDGVGDGELPGLFSVSETKKVRFSQGNLQYQASTNTWRFAEHQYDYVGNATNGNVYEGGQKCNNASILSSGYTGWIDLFSWVGASSTKLTGDYQKYGVSTSTDDSDYGNVAGETLKADWGTAIDNSGTWYTMSSQKWTYLLSTRTVNGGTGEGRSYQRATINSDVSSGVYGLIIYPDNYTAQTSAVSYTSSEWIAMENAGCVFLSPVGRRYGTNNISNTSTHGNYWSSTANTANTVYYLGFLNTSFKPADSAARSYGRAVRLVKDAN